MAEAVLDAKRESLTRKEEISVLRAPRVSAGMDSKLAAIKSELRQIKVMLDKLGGIAATLRAIEKKPVRNVISAMALAAVVLAPSPMAEGELDAVIGRLEDACGERYRGTRDPAAHNSMYQCLSAFEAQCAMKMSETAAQVEQARERWRITCERIKVLKVKPCPHCPK